MKEHTWPSRIALAVLVIIVLFSLVGPLFLPWAPDELDTPLLGPTSDHPLGTDDVGADVLVTLMTSARLSLLIAGASSILGTSLGTLLGVISGYWRGMGMVIMRLVDIFMALPRLPLIIMLSAFVQPGVGTLVVFFVLFGWPQTARLVRSMTLSEREAGYIESARVVGARDSRILFRHLLPQVVPLATTRFVLEFQHVMIAESSLSFLGLSDPSVATWGRMIHYAFECPSLYISDVWWRWLLPPAAAIMLVALSLSLLNMQVERRFQPWLQR